MKLLIPLTVSSLLTLSAQAATISVTNGDFELGSNPDATGWVRTDGAATNSSPSTYVEVVGGFGTGRNAHLKSDGGNSIAQTITLSDEGAVDATTFTNFTISLDYGQRQNASDSNIRISLWNTTTDTELDGFDQVITGATETWTAGSYNLSYDNTAQTTGDVLEFRVTNIDADLGSNAWSNTASIDNVSITASAAVPEPSSTALLGLGGIALILRRRK